MSGFRLLRPALGQVVCGPGQSFAGPARCRLTERANQDASLTMRRASSARGGQSGRSRFRMFCAVLSDGAAHARASLASCTRQKETTSADVTRIATGRNCGDDVTSR